MCKKLALKTKQTNYGFTNKFIFYFKKHIFGQLIILQLHVDMINIMYLRRREREKLQSLYEYTLSRISPPCFFQGEDHYPRYNYGLLRGFYIHVDCETVPQLNAVLSAHVNRESLFWLPEYSLDFT